MVITNGQYKLLTGDEQAFYKPVFTAALEPRNSGEAIITIDENKLKATISSKFA